MDGEEAVQEEKVELKASTEAVEFLSSIEPRELQECLFTDSLVTESDMGRELGEFRVSVQAAGYNGKPCYLVHAKSHGAIDNNPCGTSIMAYLTCGLETLEHNHHEYLKLKDYTLDRKVHMVRQDGRLIVKKVICEREEVKKRAFSFPLDSLQGFVSEASNLLILRVLARRKKVPENMTFLSFNTETRVSLSTYRDLGQKKQMVETEVVDVFGIERTISTKEDDLATWQCYFLFDGHLASRVQVGSPARMKLLQLPVHSSQEEDLKPVFEKRPLVWEEDMELYIKFLERKEELKADHSSYVKHHPELKALLADFLQFLLLRKPHDVFSFAQDYFAPFSSRQPPGGAFHSARTLRLPERQEIDKP
ncbi:ciliogenesis-associated TTC17-interacting protein [Chanos chanos]|uniref:Ciliogenesis-associated TTC17-interacting protein n=1 Tax=Chanos chanos TaxID=29144 RepID=A0A6J2W2V4_CHACN|nr:ciliogenesis-associated TTC17-interacting protein [Chanos chanos]